MYSIRTWKARHLGSSHFVMARAHCGVPHFSEIGEEFGGFFISKNVFKGSYNFISFQIWRHFFFLPEFCLFRPGGDIFMLFGKLAFCQTAY